MASMNFLLIFLFFLGPNPVVVYIVGARMLVAWPAAFDAALWLACLFTVNWKNML